MQTIAFTKSMQSVNNPINPNVAVQEIRKDFIFDQLAIVSGVKKFCILLPI